MIGRLKAVSMKSTGRQFASPARSKESFGDRVRAMLRSASTPTSGSRVGRNRRILSITVALYLAFVVIASLVYNVAILREQGVVRRELETGSMRVASMQRLMTQVEAERQSGVELQARLEQLYRDLPGAVELPVVMARLAELPTWSGGSISGVEYSEPRWSGDLGQLQTHASLRGSLREVVAYIEAVKAMLPAASLERLTVRLDGEPGMIQADLLLAAAVIRERSAGQHAWDEAGALRRAEAAAREADVAGHPFTPGARLWREARNAGVSLPELRLAGIARRDGEAVALLVYHGNTMLARSGDRAGAIEVLSVDPEGVTVSVGGRTLRLEMGRGSLEMTNLGE